MQHCCKKNDLDLVFLYDELMTKEEQERMKLNFQFVGYAYVQSYKMFHYRKSIVVMHQKDAKGKFGNDRVFGSVYLVPKFSYNSIILDAYYYCSIGRLGKSTEHDMRTRERVSCHLFELNSLEELICHKYNDLKVATAWIYLGNPSDYRLKRHIDYGRSRLVSGIYQNGFNKLLIEGGIVKV